MVKAQTKDVSVHIRINENCNKKLNEIMAVHGWNCNSAVEYSIIEMHREMVRDGYISARYDNEIYDDLGVKTAAKITAVVKGKKID